MGDPRCGQQELNRLLYSTGRRAMHVVAIVVILVVIVFILCAVSGRFRGRGV
jgi:hypothetical protein